MTDHSGAKVEFLEWLQKRGKERGYSPTIDRSARVLYERPRLLARTRSSVRQGHSVNFKINDEVEYDSKEFDQVFSIILKLSDTREWNPSRDSFYPISIGVLSNWTNGDRNGDYPVTVDLSTDLLKQRKNSLQMLFPTDSGADEEVPADRIKDEQMKGLNDIARDL